MSPTDYRQDPDAHAEELTGALGQGYNQSHVDQQDDNAARTSAVKLPNSDRAVVDPNKVTEYLLNAAHPDNSGKAQFFEALGFSGSASSNLATSLRELAAAGDVVLQVESAHGVKYVVDGRFESPLGKRPVVRTVWIIDKGQELPRLVTAYPHED